MCGISRSTHPAILKQIPLLISELFPFFHHIFEILILFVLYFKNYKRQVVSWNCKHVQHVKIYLPCNLEVNPITNFDRLCKLEKRGDEINKKIFSSETTGPIATKLLWNDPWTAPFQKMFPVIPTSNQDGRQAKNRKKGDEIKKKILPTETTEPVSTKLCWNDPWVVPFQILSVSTVLYPRWPPLLKIEISSNGQKLLYFKPESAQIWTV